MSFFKLIGGAFFSLVLTACVNKTTDFALPQQIDFKGETYVPVSKSQIDEMQHWLYLPQTSARDPNHWQKGFLLFTDKNSAHKSLADRLALRETAFKQQTDTHATLRIEQNELRSQVIYPPITQHPDVQLEISRGRDLACGFGQVQFSEKRHVPTQGRGKNPKILPAQYQRELVRLNAEISQLAWQIQCQ